MLILHCENHGHPMLLSERRIRGMESGPDGMIIDWECYCGWRGRWHARDERQPLARDR